MHLILVAILFVTVLPSSGYPAIHDGEELDGALPVGRLMALEKAGNVERVLDSCSGTLIESDLVLTAGHCIEAYMHENGAIVLPPHTSLKMTFAKEYVSGRSRTYVVSHIYHQIPRPDSPAYLRWLGAGFANQHNLDAVDTASGIDVALLKLAESPSAIEGIRPAIVRALPDTNSENRLLIGSGIFGYRDNDLLRGRSKAGVRHRGTIDTISRRSETASFVLVHMRPSGTAGRLVGPDSGDSGGFFGTVEDDDYTVEGVICAITRNPRAMASGGVIPARIRAIDASTVGWISEAKNYLQTSGRPFATSQPNTDLSRLSLDNFVYLRTPYWFHQPKTARELLHQFRADERPALMSRSYHISAGGIFPSLELHYRGTWNGESFTLVLRAAFDSDVEVGRVETAIRQNWQQGPPQCFLRDRMMVTTIDAFPALIRTETIGRTTCTGVTELY